jgi:hypothetical protein
MGNYYRCSLSTPMYIQPQRRMADHGCGMKKSKEEYTHVSKVLSKQVSK